MNIKNLTILPLMNIEDIYDSTVRRAEKTYFIIEKQNNDNSYQALQIRIHKNIHTINIERTTIINGNFFVRFDSSLQYDALRPFKPLTIEKSKEIITNVISRTYYKIIAYCDKCYNFKELKKVSEKTLINDLIKHDEDKRFKNGDGIKKIKSMCGRHNIRNFKFTWELIKSIFVNKNTFL
jgi:hypothetical protein